MSKRIVAVAAVVALALVPTTAFAGKKKKATSGTSSVPSGPQNNGSGVGIGAGGVPALRDRIEERLYVLEGDVAALQAALLALTNQVTALTGQVQALSTQIQQLSGQVAGQGDAIADLDDRATALEAIHVDGDADGYVVHAFPDCDDADANVNPGATDPANGDDRNCDGQP
jgi:peptidoglycan hydrolase CwlO-like protein